MFDEAKGVRLLVDEALKGENRLVFHPCDNTCSVALSGKDFFEKFLPAVGHDAVFVSMEESGAASLIRREEGNERYEYFFSATDPETVNAALSRHLLS